MSFLRHGKSIDPMLELKNAGSRSCSLPPVLIGLDEFQLAIPWRFALQLSRLRFTNRGQCAVNSSYRSSIFHRTANYLLTDCLTPRGKRSPTRQQLGIQI